MAEAGLPPTHEQFYRLTSDLERLLSVSFPDGNDAVRVREMVLASVSDDSMGMATVQRGDRIEVGYHVAILAARKPR